MVRRRETRRERPTEEFDGLVALYREIVLRIVGDKGVRRTISLLGLTDREYADRWVLKQGAHLDRIGDSAVPRMDLMDLAYETATKPRG